MAGLTYFIVFTVGLISGLFLTCIVQAGKH
ncbi:unknown [Roseburia sp. CAG:471]|nr:unknown [Roseburia sp. CAG:471]